MLEETAMILDQKFLIEGILFLQQSRNLYVGSPRTVCNGLMFCTIYVGVL